MYLIDKEHNTIEEIQEKTFSELGFNERQHLQEWIADNPGSLGEELLIIQKEFSGFDDTNERLDLLALDKQGNIVVIENKLDDSGRDVTWQALKYASYCSTLTKAQVRDIYQQYLARYAGNENAEEKLLEFFEISDFEELSINKGQAQRIILIAHNFRKEVTSTVLWLLNYKLRIQCFRVVPFQLNDQLLLNIEQIIPLKEVEDYAIMMAEKSQEDIDTQEQLSHLQVQRKEFFKRLIEEMNKHSKLYQNVSPSKDGWIAGGSGIGAVGLHSSASKSYGRVEVYISRSSKEENKFIFDELFARKEEIEESFGGELTWERLSDKKASRIKHQLDDVNILHREDWDKMIDFMVKGMIRFEDIFKPHLDKVKRKLKSRK